MDRVDPRPLAPKPPQAQGRRGWTRGSSGLLRRGGDEPDDGLDAPGGEEISQAASAQVVARCPHQGVDGFGVRGDFPQGGESRRESWLGLASPGAELPVGVKAPSSPTPPEKLTALAPAVDLLAIGDGRGERDYLHGVEERAGCRTPSFAKGSFVEHPGRMEGSGERDAERVTRSFDLLCQEHDRLGEGRVFAGLACQDTVSTRARVDVINSLLADRLQRLQAEASCSGPTGAADDSLTFVDAPERRRRRPSSVQGGRVADRNMDVTVQPGRLKLASPRCPRAAATILVLDPPSVRGHEVRSR